MLYLYYERNKVLNHTNKLLSLSLKKTIDNLFVFDISKKNLAKRSTFKFYFIKDCLQTFVGPMPT